MMCRPGSLWPESCGPHIDRGLDVLTFDFIGPGQNKGKTLDHILRLPSAFGRPRC